MFQHFILNCMVFFHEFQFLFQHFKNYSIATSRAFPTQLGIFRGVLKRPEKLRLSDFKGAKKIYNFSGLFDKAGNFPRSAGKAQDVAIKNSPRTMQLVCGLTVDLADIGYTPVTGEVIPSLPAGVDVQTVFAPRIIGLA